MTTKSDQDWDAEVERFRVCLQDAKSSDMAVQAAWARLRQSYRAAYNAVAYPHGRNESLEPFPFWAAENIEEDILERVMRIEFSSSLATCLLSRLQTIASMSDLSIYTLILYFGNSFFIKGRLLMFRKRVHIFKRSTNDTWPFTEGYKRMLCDAATLKHKAPVHTTDIPARTMPPLFTESLLSILAPENPEFERRAEAKEHKASKSSKMGLTGIPMSRKRLQGSVRSFLTNAAGPVPAEDGRDSQQRPTYDSNENARTPEERASQSQGHDAASSSGANRISHQYHWTRNSDSVLPSIESDDFASEATTSVKDERLGSSPAFPKLLTPMSESITDAQGQMCKSSSRKRAIKDEGEYLDEGYPSKRVATADSKADLLLQARDWDDETVVFIMERLAVSKPDFAIVNCLEAKTEQIVLISEKQQTLLIPFKLGNGQRLLALVILIPVNSTGQVGKQGHIQFVNPACSKEDEDRELSRVAVEFLQILGRILPSYESDTEKWYFQSNHPCPNQFVEADGGPALCLAAMSIVGGPLKAPLALQTDWMFWRHIILSSFFPEDELVQLRTRNYLKERVKRQVRRGQGMANNPLGPERSDYGTVASCQHGSSAQDLLRQRMIHAENLLQIAKEASHILNDLTDYIYDARISANIGLEMAKLRRQEQSRSWENKQTVSECLREISQKMSEQRAQDPGLEEVGESIRSLKSRLEKIHELHHCLKTGRNLISQFRRDIGDAVASR